MIQMFDKKVDSAAEKATALSVSRMQMSEEAEETYAEMKMIGEYTGASDLLPEEY